MRLGARTRNPARTHCRRRPAPGHLGSLAAAGKPTRPAGGHARGAIPDRMLHRANTPSPLPPHWPSVSSLRRNRRGRLKHQPEAAPPGGRGAPRAFAPLKPAALIATLMEATASSRRLARRRPAPSTARPPIGAERGTPRQTCASRQGAPKTAALRGTRSRQPRGLPPRATIDLGNRQGVEAHHSGAQRLCKIPTNGMVENGRQGLRPATPEYRSRMSGPSRPNPSPAYLSGLCCC